MYKQENRTSLEQNEVHEAIKQIYYDYEAEEDYVISEELSRNKYYKSYEPIDQLIINKETHSKFAYKKLLNVGRSITSLDVGQPWCLYWPLNTLDILEAPIEQFNEKVVKFLKYCQNKGFGGGHLQISHLAPTYSAILSLLIIGTPEAYELIDRKGLEEFFSTLKNPAYKGSYLMHVNGESDMRAVYIVVIMVILLRLDKKLIEDCAEYIVSCQTYEGGIGGVPFAEAHGGYAFCGFAALVCMGKREMIDENRLLNWVVSRQMEGEGGFNGRTNKVVDSCYSFWQGALFNLLGMKEHFQYCGQNLLNNEKLQKYITICQQPDGGLFDKPGKFADAYHTCYSLSGYYLSSSDDMDPIYNVKKQKIQKANEYFMNKYNI